MLTAQQEYTIKLLNQYETATNPVEIVLWCQKKLSTSFKKRRIHLINGKHVSRGKYYFKQILEHYLSFVRDNK